MGRNDKLILLKYMIRCYRDYLFYQEIVELSEDVRGDIFVFSFLVKVRIKVNELKGN